MDRGNEKVARGNQNPFRILDVRSDCATQRNICEAYEELWIMAFSDFRQKLNHAKEHTTQQRPILQDLHDAKEHMQQRDGCQNHPELMTRGRIIEWLKDELFIDFYDHLTNWLFKALERALKSNAQRFKISKQSISSIDTVLQVADLNTTRAMFILHDEIAILAGEPLWRFPAEYVNFPESHGPGIRDSACHICDYTMDEDTRTITHADGKCKNTFCKDCTMTWIKFCPTNTPTCPACRAPMEEAKFSLSHYLESAELQE